MGQSRQILTALLGAVLLAAATHGGGCGGCQPEKTTVTVQREIVVVATGDDDEGALHNYNALNAAPMDDDDDDDHTDPTANKKKLILMTAAQGDSSKMPLTEITKTSRHAHRRNVGSTHITTGSTDVKNDARNADPVPDSTLELIPSVNNVVEPNSYGNDGNVRGGGLHAENPADPILSDNVINVNGAANVVGNVVESNPSGNSGPDHDGRPAADAEGVREVRDVVDSPVERLSSDSDRVVNGDNSGNGVSGSTVGLATPSGSDLVDDDVDDDDDAVGNSEETVSVGRSERLGLLLARAVHSAWPERLA